MKKFSLYALLGLMGVCMSSCDEDYTDWSAPQTNPQEEAVVVPGVSATVADAVDLNNYDGSNVAVFTLGEVALPEGMTIENARINVTPTDNTEAAATEVAVTIDGGKGVIPTETLQELATMYYGKRPVARKLTAQTYLDVMDNGQAVLVDAGTLEFTVTPKAPVIASGYHLVGDMNGWNADALYPFNHSGKDVYEDPIFTLVFSTTADNQYWKIIPQNNVDANNIWADGVVGVAVDGDTSMEGNLVNVNAQAGKIEAAGMYKLTIDMMEYTYKIEKLNFGEFYYEIGNESNWSTSHALYGANFDGKYFGYYYLNGEFKFKPNADNWKGDLEFVDGNAMGGTLTEGGGPNCGDPGAGFYRIDLDVAALTYKLTAVNGISIIGTVNGNWNTDTDLTYNTSTGAWEYTGALNAGEMKFRMNHDWAISWGGADFNSLTEHNGANLQLAEAGTYAIQLFISHEGKNYCTVTKQ